MKIQKDLTQIGLYLEGYKIDIPYPTENQEEEPFIEKQEELEEQILPLNEVNEYCR